MKRHILIKKLKKLLGTNFFIKPSEEFNGQKGAIWTTGEELSPKLQEKPFDYYNGDHPQVTELLNEAEWYVEWYDPGTAFLYPKE